MEYKAKDKTVVINTKPRRRRLRVGDPDFVPPDGGWGWLVVFACGFSNLSTFPMSQQFGLIFKDKFESLGITKTQTTFITNLNSAFNLGVGLANGPVYRKYTYRQVSMICAVVVCASLMASVFCSTFWQYVIFYCIFYGSSFGMIQSANALAVNTYFKEKRRVAVGLTWTTTALGPIIWPYVIVSLGEVYGMDGVMMLFAGFALHAFVCALLLQPVEWHTKFKEEAPEVEKFMKPPQDAGRLSRISSKIFSNQNLGTEGDPNQAGYEITDPGAPMMVRANDGWYSQSKSQLGSRVSLSSNKGTKQEVDSKRSDISREREQRKKDKKASQEGRAIQEEVEEKEPMLKDDLLKVPDEETVLKSAAKKLAAYEDEQQMNEEHLQSLETREGKNEHFSIWQKIAIFFDFGLFKDLIYVNLMVGITIANFAELNFSILTPLIMAEFNFPKYEIASYMSLLGTVDIVVRFFIPFVADKLGWSNRVFFLIGIMSMAIGRLILIHTQTYRVALAVAVMVGIGKALRTIFMALVIPSHVPIERLPAASGLQLAFSGILYIVLGPLVGWIRELVGNYVITLHILNICTYITTIFWIAEILISKTKKKQMLEKNGLPK